MLFNSLVFAIFLPLVYGIYWSLQGRLRWQNLFLLAASYVFYGWWDWRFLALLFISSSVDYAVGLRLDATDDPRRRKRLLAVSLGTNLGILGFFKYFNFFAQSTQAALAAVGLHADIWTLHVILPVGVSFYSFQALSYSIDIYRRQLKPTRDFIGYHTFGCFFPQLVSGPIERARQLLPQILAPRTFDMELGKDGLRQMLWGFVKKVVVADNLAAAVTSIFADAPHMSRVHLISGAAGFALQLYGDFSGYSDIAIGCGKLFGIRLVRNFAHPFFAQNMAELWRRWHISLTSWFRDYVYIPLGGSRVRPLRRAANVLITFTVSGLWHGANWTFVTWGALNGLGVLPTTFAAKGHRGPKDRIVPGQALPSPSEAVRMALTFALFTLFLVFFRADTIQHAAIYLLGIGAPHGVRAAHVFGTPNRGLAFGAAMLLVEWVQRNRSHGLDLAHLPVRTRWALYTATAIGIVLLGNLGSVTFVYFQF